MKDPARGHRLYSRAALTLTALALILLSPYASDAQVTRSEREARRVDMQMRQWALRDIERLKNERPAKTRDTRPAYSDVEQDFEQLQLANYSLAGAAEQGVALDYELIRKQAEEVRKRASRLKVYLSLPKVEEGQAQVKGLDVQTPEGLRSAVASLDALVNAFAWNPVFRKSDVVDLEQSSKASRDLASVISLSERIRRRAAELAKGSKADAKK
jgi:hypothetical protein